MRDLNFIKNNFNVKTFEDFEEHIELQCDALVIGSGAGGAPLACRLAENGIDTILIEEGGYFLTKDFDSDVLNSVLNLYRDGGGGVALGKPPINFVEGRCVGGSTVINGAMSWKTPEKIMHRWRLEAGLEFFNQEFMDNYFTEFESDANVAKQDPESIGKDSHLIKQGADKLGYKVLDNTRNQFHCAGSNNCAWGCPLGAKQSTLVTYIPRFLKAGGRLFSNMKASKLIRDGKKVLGVKGKIKSTDYKDSGLKFSIRAGKTIVSCGSVQTPVLLLRSGINPNNRVGMNLSLHPNIKIVGVFEDKVTGWHGTHQAFQVREFQEEGFLMAASNIPPAALAFSSKMVGNEMESFLELYDHMVVCGVLVDDTITGRVKKGLFGIPQVSYQLTEYDYERFRRGVSITAEILFSAGAKEVWLPFNEIKRITSLDQIRHIFDRKIDYTKLDLFTVHLMGTCAMNENPGAGVVDASGRVKDYQDLLISDASFFPTPIGVNPMETIASVSLKIADDLLKEIKPAKA